MQCPTGPGDGDSDRLGFALGLQSPWCWRAEASCFSSARSSTLEVFLLAVWFCTFFRVPEVLLLSEKHLGARPSPYALLALHELCGLGGLGQSWSCTERACRVAAARGLPEGCRLLPDQTDDTDTTVQKLLAVAFQG